MAKFFKSKKQSDPDLNPDVVVTEAEAQVEDVKADDVKKQYFGQSLSFLTDEKKKLEDKARDLEQEMADLQASYTQLLEERRRVSGEQQKALSDFNDVSLEYLEKELPSSIATLTTSDVDGNDEELRIFLDKKKAILQDMKDVETEKGDICAALDSQLFERAEQINKLRGETERVAQTSQYLEEAIRGAGNIEDEEEALDGQPKAKKPKSSKRHVASQVRGVFFFNLIPMLKQDCEVQYTVLKLVIHYLVAFVAIALIGMLYELQLPYTLALCIVYFVFGPSLIYFSHRKKYEKKKFTSAVRYIEQMIFSFTRNSKLMNSLEETRLLMSGKVADAIDYAIAKLRHGQSSGDLYDAALVEIENIYPCTRVKNLHEFIKDVERDGGEFSSALDIMLEDVREWDVRTNNFMQEQTVKGMSIVVSILMSLGVCFFMSNVLPDDMGGNISGFALYQIVSTLSLIIMFFIYRFSARKLTSSWVNDDLGEDGRQIKADYQAVKRYVENPSGKIKPILAITRMQTAMEKSFPRWVMRFSLLASRRPIPVALAESSAKAPRVMREELAKLNANLESNPYGVQPYMEFFKDYDLPQVRSMMMMVYSLGSADTQDIEKHILSIVKRNHLLQAAAEKIEYDEKMALFTLFSTVPMLLACVIMMIDVAMIVMNMLDTVL